jgi:molybdopterin molybdotransferase
MISVEQALKAIDENVSVAKAIQMNLSKALGYVLAEDITSPMDMPPFPQSAMDGYAVKLNGTNTFNLVGEVKAGDGHEPQLNQGEAIRIFTGAPVTASADLVVRQEDCNVVENVLEVNPLPKTGANIRPKAEQTVSGDIALRKGQAINAAAIGYLATLGVTEVSVFPKPKVAILVTGNELVAPGQELNYGQIYESNAIMLQSALTNYGIEQSDVYRVKDDYESTSQQLDQMLKEYDVILCSGGISVGDYDFVGKALIELDVKEIFYKIKQKPGKPLFFGKKENALVFALPGNPAAALTCFNVYVIKALNLLTGKRPQGLVRIKKNITTDFSRKGDRAQFLKGSICGNEVAIMEGQSSAMLHTYALSNTLVFIPLEMTSVKKGEPVECILI